MSFWRALSPVPAVAALLVAAITFALGMWQLDRGHQKEQREASLRAHAAQPAIRLGGMPRPEDAAAFANRRVVATGRFDTARTVLLDNRPHGNGQDSRPGFLVVTPLQLTEAGTNVTVLVVRGWVPRDPYDRTRIPPFDTPPGTVTVEGTAQPNVPRVYALGDPGADRGQRIRQNIELDDFAAESGLPLHPVVIRQTSDTGDGLARDWPAADSGVDRHYGYAFQWFSLAGLSLVLLLLHAWRRARRQASLQSTSGTES
ncbi:SURF1 family protein [Paracidovorax citrulli]